AAPVELLEVGAEPVQVEHVPEQVPQALVRERRREQRPRAPLGEHARPAHGEVRLHERVQAAELPQDEDDDVQDDELVADGRRGPPAGQRPRAPVLVHVVATVDAHGRRFSTTPGNTATDPYPGSAVTLKLAQLAALPLALLAVALTVTPRNP